MLFNFKKSEEGKKGAFRKARTFIIVALVLSILSGSVLTARQKQAEAFSLCTNCILCIPGDTLITIFILNLLQEFWDGIIEDDIEELLNMEENWIVEDFFEDFWVRALAELTEFLGAFGMYQVEMVGAFFDAKNQLETSRLYFELQAEAHRDYHPSDDFCWFGTNARSLAASEARSKTNLIGLSQRAIQRQLGTKDMSSAKSIAADKDARWRQFVDTYCDPKDNGWDAIGGGLEPACDRDGPGGASNYGAVDTRRINMDIDYTRLIENNRTLDLNFSYPPPPPTPTAAVLNLTDDEEDVLAMSSNLFGATIPDRSMTHQFMNSYPALRYLHMDLRSVVAKRDVAMNSFNTIVSMKSAGTSGATSGADTASFMAAIFRDLMPGATDPEIFEILGDNPSYYAQLEVLAKQIYLNPDFYANLYDTPANVQRKSVAMKAINLMLDRALFESELRQEMMLSVMLSSELNSRYRKVSKEMYDDK